MTKMSRILCVVLAFAMVLAFAACGKKEAANNDTVNNDTVNNEVADFVKENKAALVESFETNFEESSGLDADCSVSAKGNSIAFKVCLEDVDDIPEEAKAQMQEGFDAIQDEFASEFEDVKEELGSVESIIIDVCEEDGDLLASIEAKF